MGQASEIASVKQSLWDRAYRSANQHNRNKLFNLEKALKSGEDSLAELHQRHQEANAKVGSMSVQLPHHGGET